MKFQRIESMQLDGRRCGQGRSSRRLGSASRPPTDDEDDSVRVHLADTTTPSTTPGEEVCLTRLNVPSTHASSRRTSANSSVYSRMPDNFNLFRMGGINWCLWTAFIVITMLLVPAHLYLKNSNYRGELIGILFVIILLFLVCFSVSLFHTKTRAILLHRLNLEDDARGCTLDSETASPSRRRPLFPSTTLTNNRLPRHLSYPLVRVSMSSPDLLINGQTTSATERVGRSHPHVTRGTLNGVLRSYELTDQRPQASPATDAGSDPPPYHLAILLPTPTHSPNSRECETPPPAYEIVQ
ncbi:uncharacterized protein LOC121870657 isoform X2 [Homarus americanus]|uniref:Uncharacterized protein n=1 Tax=Homarus americanus TaxID=6706 RepID=A0A8J5MVZ6_HOMAM|nr:uncharacterized protein LOC121870657 isoform X2 [Homarus americanus]KAG7165427.1 hypothetical protein Hamer_G007259 [Homarus americanus]